jgi:hypothetical protein
MKDTHILPFYHFIILSFHIVPVKILSQKMLLSISVHSLSPLLTLLTVNQLKDSEANEEHHHHLERLSVGG